jgi:acyl-[acyl-carrier-protein] desaturase
VNMLVSHQSAASPLPPPDQRGLKADIIESLQGFVREHLSLLTPPEQIWQPTDYLPDFTADDWAEQVERFRQPAQRLPDDFLVVLVGNMVTEEALPNYAISLEHVVRDPTGTTQTPWAQWLRGWTAEENRHGDLLNAYLRLTGRVDMRAVERTVYHLIRNGFSPENQGNDHAGLIYAAFQERATRLTHGNIGRLAEEHGEENLARICRKVAADETRHEVFYTKVVAQMIERDPEGTVLAYRKMLKQIAMPGSRMYDGADLRLFEHYSVVAQRTGVYTARDYGGIVRHLNEAWNLGHQSLSGKAAKAQDYICRQPDRYEILADEIAEQVAAQPIVSFSWLRRQSA